MSQAADLLIARLPKEEGEELLPYDDATSLPVRAPVGNLSWGRGYNLMKCGSPALFDVIDAELVGAIEEQLLAYPWYIALSPVRQSVVLDIAYNEGVTGLLHFPHMIVALQSCNWARAAAECSVFRTNPSLDRSRYAPLRALLLSG